MEYEVKKKLIKWAVIGSLFIGLCAVIQFIFNTSYITVTVAGGKGDINYHYLNQGSDKSADKKTVNTTVKKRVGRGTHEVTITSNGASYFTVVKTSGFLKSTRVVAEIKPEDKREFIGDNPGPCAFYDSVLLSYACTGVLSDVAIHKPATADSVTTTETSTDPDFEASEIGGFITLSGKRYLYTQTPDLHDAVERQAQLLEIGDDLLVKSVINLKNVPTSSYQEIKPFRDGFIIFSKVSNEARYFKTPTSEPEVIKITPYSSPGYSSEGTFVSSSRVGAIYVDNDQSTEDIDDEEPKDSKTGVVITNGNQQQEYTIERYYTKALFCGENYLCFQSGTKLYLYKITDEKLEEQYFISHVTNFEVSDKTVLISRDNQIIRLSPAEVKGVIGYSFGDYANCGVNTTQTAGYLVCTINKANDRAMLYVDPSTPNTDNIDKKVLDLSQKPDVEHVSAYKNFITVVPNTGPPVYNAATQGFGPDPAVQAEVRARIQKAISSIGFGQNYVVTNP
jgi:hypothetical protein